MQQSWALLLKALLLPSLHHSLAVDGPELPEYCAHTLAGKDNDFGCCPCDTLDAYILSSFERHLFRNQHQEKRIWHDRHACLKQRNSLQRRCRSSRGGGNWLIDACTRGPATYWAARQHNVTDRAFAALRESCGQQRFLLWTRHHGDYYAGYTHSLSAFECAISEAVRLKRTLIYDDFIALNGKRMDTVEGFVHGIEIPRRAWRDKSRMDLIPGVPWSNFVTTCGVEGLFVEGKTMVTMPHNTHLREMAARKDVPLLIRDFSGVSTTATHGEAFSGNDVCETCGVERLPDVGRYSAESRRVRSRASAVLQVLADKASGSSSGAEEPADIVCLHVRRGPYLKKGKYAKLDKETRPEAVLKKLKGVVRPGSVLYIVSNFKEPEKYFKPLKEEYDIVTFNDLMNRNMTHLRLDNLVAPTIGWIETSVLRSCPHVIPTFRDENAIAGAGNMFDGGVSLSSHCKDSASDMCRSTAISR